MKSIENLSITDETSEKILSLIGSEKIYKCDGKTVIKPSNAEDISHVIAVVLNAKGSIAPLSMKGKHVDVDVYIDMSNMTSIINIDKVSMTARVQVGCKVSTLRNAVAVDGFTLGAFPTGENSTVEDWVYKEEPGIGSYKYGTSKDCVSNIIAVDYTGSVFETGYDSIGCYMSAYNLMQTLSASNGKLAIIYEATLKLFPEGITKTVAYKLNSIENIQSALIRIVHDPSIKPLHISFDETKIIIAFQGDEKFVDTDINTVDAILKEIGATKIDGKMCLDDIISCERVDNKINKSYIPLKNLSRYIVACKSIANFKIRGNVPDRSTVVVKLFGDIKNDEYSFAADKADELGGRSCCRCHSIYRDEGTKKFMKRIEYGFLGGTVECTDLTRDITPEIISKLKTIVGCNNVNVGKMDRILYSHDLAPLPKEAGLAFDNIPDVIIRPENIEHISRVMRLAYDNGIPVTPRGNASWGLGGCMPTVSGIVLDMSSKMNKIIEINTEELYVKVQAGCTWKKVLDACTKRGYIIGSYPSSFPQGTVGAWISTNGMGIGSYKYGSAKDNIITSEVVVDDGTIITTGFDGTGSYGAMYNLNQFFAGAEGTLGIISTVTFRIYPMGNIRCLSYEFNELKDINGPMQELVRHPSVRPLHVAWSDYMHFKNQRKAGIHAPNVKNLWLVTLQGDEIHNDLEESILDEIAKKFGGIKVISDISEHEWEERCYEFRARKVGVGEIPAEVIVPVQHWGKFTDECYRGFEKMKMEPGGIIGVLVDRNTELFMPYYFKDDELLTGMLSFGFNFYLGNRAAEYGGRSTGFGVFFAWMLDVIHSSITSDKMRDLKTTLDPHDVINPGHVVCASTRFGINLNETIMSLGSTIMQTVKKIMPNDKTFKYNIKRFRYDDLEHIKAIDRTHTLGDGTQ